MATRFEILLHGENAAGLRAAGEEALDEVERLEAQLSLYRPGSEIARVNAQAARRAVGVSPPVFQLLRRAEQLHRECGGAFDITIGPLARCWGFMDGTGHLPGAAELALARELVGMGHVILDGDDFSVRFDREGVMIDLGAIGKGYAMDCAARTLREAGVASALLHGGTSTTCAIGHPPDAEDWKVAVAASPESCAQTRPPLATVRLRDEALSVSAGWGNSLKPGEGFMATCSTREPASRLPTPCWRRSFCLRRRNRMRCPRRCWWRGRAESGGLGNCGPGCGRWWPQARAPAAASCAGEICEFERKPLKKLRSAATVFPNAR